MKLSNAILVGVIAAATIAIPIAANRLYESQLPAEILLPADESVHESVTTTTTIAETSVPIVTYTSAAVTTAAPPITTTPQTTTTPLTTTKPQTTTAPQTTTIQSFSEYDDVPPPEYDNVPVTRAPFQEVEMDSSEGLEIPDDFEFDPYDYFN